MVFTNTKENGLETLIVKWLVKLLKFLIMRL